MGVWNDRVINGVRHSFTHLQDFDMKLERPAKGKWAALNISIRVVFDCHVVTEEDPSQVPARVLTDPAYWIDSGNRCRHFHLDRYHRSFDLPGMIRGLTLGQTKCYFAKHGNYMVWKPDGAGANGPHYQVYFEIYRTETPIPRLVMYVKSAYLKDIPSGIQREREVVFATLCAELMGLIPPKPGTKAHQKR